VLTHSSLKPGVKSTNVLTYKSHDKISSCDCKESEDKGCNIVEKPLFMSVTAALNVFTRTVSTVKIWVWQMS